MELRERFGRRVAAMRRHHKLTQDALASVAGLSVDMISRIEGATTGVSFATVAKLAAALDTDPGAFFAEQLTDGPARRPELAAIIDRLASLTDEELVWLSGLMDAALKPRR